MEHNMLTLDFWQDRVTYEGHMMPTGTMGCEALNIADDAIERLTVLCGPLNRLMRVLQTGQYDVALLSEAGNAVKDILDLLHAIPPFSRLDMDFYIPALAEAYTAEGLHDLQAYTTAFMGRTLSAEQAAQYRKGILLGRITPVLAHLGYALGEYKKTMLPFAEIMDAQEADRSIKGFAELFGQIFPPEITLSKDAAWMSLTNTTIQYVSSVMPGKPTAQLVKRMHFVTFVGLLRADLFEGLCVGHAPKNCGCCGTWFLTTDARHTKYCGNPYPGDKLGRSCRSISNLKGREMRELEADHPLKKIYNRRMNTIDHGIQRGTLDGELAAAMKKLAKDKMLRSLRDTAYAKGSYEAEMKQEAILQEAKRLLHRA